MYIDNFMNDSFRCDRYKLKISFVSAFMTNDNIPILFTCNDDVGSLYLCICNSVYKKYRWVVARCDITTIRDMNDGKISIYDAFKSSNESYLIVEDTNGCKYYIKKSISQLIRDNELPDQDVMLDSDFSINI